MARSATAAIADDVGAAEADAALHADDIDMDGDELYEPNRELVADNLIKDYVIASVSASIVPIAFFDIAAVVVIQLRMIQKLSQLYGRPFSESQGRKAITALIGGVLGYGAGYMVAASATKLIPGVGWMIGMVSLPVVAGASTFAVGRSIVRHYEDGGTLMDFNAGKMRAFYKEQFENGKELARKLKDKTRAEAKDLKEEVAS